MSSGVNSVAMVRALLIAALVLSAGCRRPPAETGASRRDAAVDEAITAEEAQEDAHRPPLHAANAIAAAAAPEVSVTGALVEQYLRYRQLVVERGRTAVESYRQTKSRQRDAESTAGIVRSARATEEFAARMRAVEEAARAEVGLSRDQVAAVGQVAAEVLSARQLWRMSGGDEALAKARAELASLPPARRRAAQKALARNEQGFAEMREARSARKRFGDAAVEAVLAHEETLWKVQQDGARVMAEVY